MNAPGKIGHQQVPHQPVSRSGPKTQGQHGVQQQAAQAEVQRAGKEAPPGVVDGREGVPFHALEPDTALLQPDHFLQIFSRIQIPVLDPVGLHGAAQGAGRIQVVGLALETGFLLPEGGGQVQRARLHGPDVLQGELELAEELDPAQDVQIGPGIVPVAVFTAGGGEQPLFFIKTDVGPGHAQSRFQLADVHGYTS